MNENNIKDAFIGMNLNSLTGKLKPGEISYAMNAVVESFDGNEVAYQNEQANEFCVQFPEGYKVIGRLNIIEKGFVLVWMYNPSSDKSEIGKIENCTYKTIIEGDCLNHSLDDPILKAVYRLTECNLEIYWASKKNPRRYIDLYNLPFKQIVGENSCDITTINEIDCNKLKVQPNFLVPNIEVAEVDIDGELTAGTVQFAIQYANSNGEAYTSYYSVTNPLPIADTTKITPDFNYKVNKSVKLSITNIDTTGYYDYINVAVIESVNGITTPYLIGTFDVTGSTKQIIYSGQKKKDLNIDDIFEKYPIYDNAEDVTTAQDILIWSQLTSVERVNYQKIANKLELNWVTNRLKDDAYKDPLKAQKYKSEMRDEIVSYELCFILKNGHQTDGFHIPGREAISSELSYIYNNDTPGENPMPYYQVYNTASVSGFEPAYTGSADYEGPYQYGKFAYWESVEKYPCNTDIWGGLANLPIRHPRYPDNLVSNIHDNSGYIYPIGIKLDYYQLVEAINSSGLTQEQKENIAGFKILRGNRAGNKSIIAKGLIHNVGKYTKDSNTFYYPNYPYNDTNVDPFLTYTQSGDDSGLNAGMRLDGFSSDESKQRFTFHSPDTHFTQPSLGNILKVESIEYGQSSGHFVQVKNHAKYKFLTQGAYFEALILSAGVGLASATIGVSTNIFNGTAAFTAFQALMEILDKTAPKKNMVYQYNSIGNYNKTIPIANDGNKQRLIDLSQYIISGYQNTGDIHDINNVQRESSVYLKTNRKLKFTHEVPGAPKDNSRWRNSSFVINPNEIKQRTISSYYVSIKRNVENLWGQIYSYETIDTGFQDTIDKDNYLNYPQYRYIFGGDTFINKFSYKSKFPYFIDNRVSTNTLTFPDEADIDFRDFANVAYPNFWFATNSVTNSNGSIPGLPALNLKQFFGIKVNNFDNTEFSTLYQMGKIYLHSYGIPTFYCESQVNVDLRQAYNNKEGEFYPHVSSGIPDEWLQETNVSIQNDNTYIYNKTFSKQNKENNFSHLPVDFSKDICKTRYTNRAIFSESRTTEINSGRRNNWLIYKALSKNDFPENYGRLISLDGIENQQVLARFTNKTLLYNAMLTAPTSAADVYLGKSLFSQQVPPLDYADTDLGYVGSQHKFLLKTEFGHVTVDALRGQLFVLRGNKAEDISGNISKFLTEFLDLQLPKYIPSVNPDNHYNGVGIHGVYDSKYDRLIFTKLDYKPRFSAITHSDGKFYLGDTEIQLTNTKYFENLSFTLSYDFNNGGWVSFHSYLPNFYIGDSNIFYSGRNDIESSWRHNSSTTKLNNFYGVIEPYQLEIPFSYLPNDEILQSIYDFSKVYQYDNWYEFVETDDYFFNKAILSTPQQTSGVLNLVQKPKNNLSLYGKYPKYNSDSKDILYTKSKGVYQYNQFWSLVKNQKQPLWVKSDKNLSYFKDLNQVNMNYSKQSYKKEPIRTKELKVRHILDDRDDIKIISQILITETKTSAK